jgi:hypothetical protein
MLARRNPHDLLRRLAGCVVAPAVACAFALAPAARASAQDLPSRLDDSTFWKLVTDYSEPGGYFRSDNFVSNEMAFQYVIPTLLQTTKPGGVYLGVGPDQNFTYIVALKPKLAFIFDIRRGNLEEHLLYKAVIEMSDTRADFLSRLFSRPRPAGLDTAVSADSLLRAYAGVPPNDSLYQRNLKAVKEWLTSHHHFALGDSDLAGIEYVYSAFSEAGPDLTYNFGNGRGNFRGFGRGMPTYAELMIQTDGKGAHRSYIANEANYRALRQHELDNAIVPLVGNFAGDKAIKSVGGYLKEHHATVTAFYLSNVEQYLWNPNGGDDGRKFFGNVAALPLDSASTFIRAVFNGGGYRGAAGGGGMRGPTILASMVDQLKAFNEGHINSYYDVIQFSK